MPVARNNPAKTRPSLEAALYVSRKRPCRRNVPNNPGNAANPRLLVQTLTGPLSEAAVFLSKVLNASAILLSRGQNAYLETLDFK